MRRVRIAPSFWVLLALVYWIEPGLLLPTALAAAAHELGHAAALWLVGGRAEGLALSAVGAELKIAGSLSYTRELPVTLAGPAVSLALAWGAARAGRFLLAGISLALGLFNLLPILPLDGGRAAECLSGLLLGPVGAQRLQDILAAVSLGTLLAFGAIALAQGFGFGLLAMGLWLGWNQLRGGKIA